MVSFGVHVCILYTFSCIPTVAEYVYWIINGIQASILCKERNCWYSSYTLWVRCNEEFDEAQIVCGITEGNSNPAYLVVIMEISTTHNKPITGKISSLTSRLHTWSHYLCLCTCMDVHTHTSTYIHTLENGSHSKILSELIPILTVCK